MKVEGSSISNKVKNTWPEVSGFRYWVMLYNNLIFSWLNLCTFNWLVKVNLLGTSLEQFERANCDSIFNACRKYDIGTS